MNTIDKTNIQALCSLLRDTGVHDAVVSPGSRNAGINIAMSVCGDFRVRTVIDERVAAFVALGMASQGSPVALVCTSGTAVLNYGPAVAEAYYRRVPLIVISADRPSSAIDQRDSQTIRQPGALASVVRCCVDVPDTADAVLCRRLINEALDAATGNIPGPVHINMPLSRPLTPLVQSEPAPFCRLKTLHALMPDVTALTELLVRIDRAPKVLIACGSSRPLTIPEAVLRRGNVVTAAEVTSNLEHSGLNVHPLIVTNSQVRRNESLYPDIIINIGGAPVFDSFKSFLRRTGAEVINVGFDDCVVDTFYNLTTRVEIAPQSFFDLWATISENSAHSKNPIGSYAEQWRRLPRPAKPGCWCDASAIEMLAEAATPDGFVFLANGMCVRYAQLCRWKAREIFANRGVSGIDGCTSTAAGLSMATDRTVLLLTGDMGMAYDIGALALKQIGSNFKIAVIDNDGGDIFRHVATTAPFVETQTGNMITASPRLPLRELAEAYGFTYFSTDSEDSAPKAVKSFMNEKQKPAILHIKTSPQANSQAYNMLFNN